MPCGASDNMHLLSSVIFLWYCYSGISLTGAMAVGGISGLQHDVQLGSGWQVRAKKCELQADSFRKQLWGDSFNEHYIFALFLFLTWKKAFSGVKFLLPEQKCIAPMFSLRWLALCLVLWETVGPVQKGYKRDFVPWMNLQNFRPMPPAAQGSSAGLLDMRTNNKKNNKGNNTLMYQWVASSLRC